MSNELSEERLILICKKRYVSKTRSNCIANQYSLILSFASKI